MTPDGLVRVACSVALGPDAAGALPTEFRIFKAGVNETSKGPIVYDAEAAAAVWAAYQREGVDLCIDLNHGVLDDTTRSDAGDARGWFKLEQRGGELWATSVTWTPDGARRLSEKTQRYISPLALRQQETDRAVRLLNVALVAMPATYDAVPLVAASKTPDVASRLRACNAVIVALAKESQARRKLRRKV